MYRARRRDAEPFKEGLYFFYYNTKKVGDNVIVIGIMIFVVICELAAIYEKMEGKNNE